MNQRYESAERVRDEEGRQYHIGVAPGELAESIMLVGDPARAELVADRFDTVELHRHQREFVTYTGTHQGLRVSVMGTGIGADNTEIAVVELMQCVKRPTLLRCGTCGAVDPTLAIGDLVLTRGALRLENTSSFFVEPGFPALADHEVLLACIAACESIQARYHVGLTATAPGFYGAQGRHVAPFMPARPNLIAELERQRVLNLEMESSCLLTLASLAGARAGAMCVVFANRAANEFIAPADKRSAELRCVEAGLDALHRLAKMDAERGERPYWTPPSSSGPTTRS